MKQQENRSTHCTERARGKQNSTDLEAKKTLKNTETNIHKRTTVWMLLYFPAVTHQMFTLE